MKKSKLCLLALIVLSTLSMIPQAYAATTETLIDNYWDSSQVSFDLKDHHPSDSVSYYSAAGQAFNCSDGNYKITKARFMLRKTGSPTGNATAVLYNITGTYGTNAEPDTVLATSDNFNVSTISSGSGGWYNLTFSGAEQYEMQANTQYAIAFQNPTNTSETIDANNYTMVYRGTSYSHSGNGFGYRNNNWISASVWDFVFQIYGDAYDPTVNEFSIPSVVYDNTDTNLIAVINDDNGLANFENASIQINNTIVLFWDADTNTFSKPSDPNNYCLFQSGTRTTVNSTAYSLTWTVRFTEEMSEGWYDLINATVWDKDDLSETNDTTADWFEYRVSTLRQAVMVAAGLMFIPLLFAMLHYSKKGHMKEIVICVIAMILVLLVMLVLSDYTLVQDL